MIQKETFCAAPWFQIRNENNGSLKPCCVIKSSKSQFSGEKDFNIQKHSINEFMSSEYMQYLRKSLSSGQKISECDKCWIKEEKNIKSERQILNDKFKLDLAWNHFLKKQDFKDWTIISADWKFSNLCNLGCIMCDPWDSSILYTQWATNSSHPIIQEKFQEKDRIEIKQVFQDKLQMSFLDDILANSNLFFLKILGGEPLIHRKLIEKLNSIDSKIKKRMSLNFITNGTVNILNFSRSLQGFKNLSFSVSVDGIGQVQESIRAGSNWTEIECNILEAKQHFVVSVHCVLQALNFSNIDHIWNWALKNNIHIDFETLVHPEHLSVGVFNLDYRNDILKSIKTKLLGTIIKSHRDFETKFDDVSTMLMSVPFNPDLKNKFLNHVKLHDKINQSRIFNTLNF